MVLLLDSRLSDDFNLGIPIDRLPRDQSVMNRIIKFKTRLEDIDFREVESFFRSNEIEREEDREVSVFGEFLMEKFLEECQLKAGFNRLVYVQEEPGAIVSRNGFVYQFMENGKGIIVYNHDKSQTVTKISRIVEISKGHERNYFVCYPKISRDQKGVSVESRIASARAFLGRGNYDLGCLRAYSSDIFRSHLSSSSIARDPSRRGTSMIEDFLRKNKNNVAVVYSNISINLAEIARRVYESITE